MPTLRTDLCDLLGTAYPILQAGMGGFAGPELAAAVSNAGGLGILAGHGISVDELRADLAAMRRATSKPFGVNLVLADDLRSPADASSISPETVREVNRALNPLREDVGLAGNEGLPKAPAKNVEEKLDLVLEAQVPVLSVGLANPGPELVERCHRQATKVIAMVTTVEDALTVSETGVDAIVVQGAEAGGHRSHFTKPNDAGYGLVGSMVLIPEVADRVRVPVIAAGGIVDGRGLIAALALGAQGAMLGTRFLATRESLAGNAYRWALLEGRSADSTVTDVASGRYARVLRNRFVEDYGKGPVLPFGWQGSAVSELFDRARELEDRERMALWAGQGVGRIEDLPSATEVVQRIVAEAERVLRRL